MAYKIGDIFKNTYPPQAAMWCNINNAHIEKKPWGYEIVANPQVDEQQILFNNLRSLRDTKLAETDFLVMPDYPILENELKLVKQYRQELRDLPDNELAPWDGGGDETPWPVMPKLTRGMK